MDNDLPMWAEFVKVQGKGGLDSAMKITLAHSANTSIMQVEPVKFSAWEELYLLLSILLVFFT